MRNKLKNYWNEHKEAIIENSIVIGGTAAMMAATLGIAVWIDRNTEEVALRADVLKTEDGTEVIAVEQPGGVWALYEKTALD